MERRCCTSHGNSSSFKPARAAQSVLPAQQALGTDLARRLRHKHAAGGWSGRGRAWSIAQGMKHRMPFRSPNMCGKVSEKAGAACTAGKKPLPMLSLSVMPKVDLTWLPFIRLRRAVASLRPRQACLRTMRHLCS